MTANCGTCNAEMERSELRPYGPGGSLICIDCVYATPEALEAAKRSYIAQLEAAAAISPVGAAILHADGGPEPYIPPQENQ